MAIVKIIELIGTSSISWEDAAKQAVKKAGESVKNITGIDVIGQKAKVEKGEITEYRVNTKVAFTVE
ncbi:dodecin domain-containing protein [Candidatus Woesearchaeota archaeon]|nr:dodecin domain-containing protein [Candidatus Woesearchaeota archaeon]